MRRPSPAHLALLALAALLAAATACGIGAPTGDHPNDRLVEIYSATIQAVAETAHPEVIDGRLAVPVFLAVRETASIDLEVQAGLVNALDDWAGIRFIDAIEEAIDMSDPAQPVRDDGVLIGLGSVPEGATEVAVYADRYERHDSIVVYHVELQRRAGEWTVLEPLRASRVTPP